MKRFLSMVLICTLICTLITSCGKKDDSAAESSANDSNKSIVITSAEWLGLDTVQVNSWDFTQWLVADTLLYLEDDGSLSPNMAKSVNVSEDGLTVTLEIPDDLCFYDGTKLTLNDVKRSIEWAMGEDNPFATDFAAVKSVEAKDPNIIFHLSEPSPTFLYDLGYYGVINIKKADELDSKTRDELLWDCTPYGLYYVSEYVSGSHVTLKRNPYYKTYNTNFENKGPANIDTITVKFMTDPFAIIQGLLSGDVTISQSVPAENLNEIPDNGDLEKKWVGSTCVTVMGLNNDDPLFSDPEVRKAIMLMVNRDEIVDYSDGERVPAYSFVVPGMTDYSADVGEYCKSTLSNNKEQGLKILADKGWKDSDGDGYLDKNGQKFEFELSFLPTDRNVAELLQIAFKGSGISILMNNVEDYSIIEASVKDETYQAFMNTYGWGDAGGILPYICLDENIIDMDQYLGTLQKAVIQADKTARVEGYNSAQKMMLDSKCYFPLTQSKTLAVYNKTQLQDLFFRADGVIFYNDIK